MSDNSDHNPKKLPDEAVNRAVPAGKVYDGGIVRLAPTAAPTADYRQRAQWRSWLLWLIGGAVLIILGIAIGQIRKNIIGEDIPFPTPNQTYVALSTEIAIAARATPTASYTPTATDTPIATPTSTRTHTPTRTPTNTPSPTPTPDVILLGVNALGEMNTVEYELKTVVDKEGIQAGRIKIGNRELLRPRIHFLLVAEGRVKAGIDFKEMVRYEIVDDNVTVYLPAPRISDYYVDPESFELYPIAGWDDVQGLLVSKEFAAEQYNAAIVDAQESIKRAALESGILEVAETNAAALVQSLVMGLGFSSVEVIFIARGDEADLLDVAPRFTPAPFPNAAP